MHKIRGCPERRLRKKQSTTIAEGNPMTRLTVSAFASASATAALFFAATGNAGNHSPHVVVGDRADADPTAVAHFTCEKRPFDRTKGLFCYGPAAIRSAYGVNGLLSAGFDGRGHTIVILDAFGSPAAADDLKLFDKTFGLPDPSFTIITMPGTPPFDPTNANMVGWAGEIALDTQWSHAMAPAANIILIAAKSDSDQDLTAALNYAIDNNLGDVISMSFGESEAVLANPDGLDAVKAWNDAFAKARSKHITLFVSSGDQGSDTQSLMLQSVSWPASSALVTGVGGTNLKFGTTTNADPNGTYQSEMVWNDGFGAGGGGMSILTKEPNFQKNNVPAAVNIVLHNHRGVPDVAYNAGVVGGVIGAFGVPFGPGAFFIFGGTSAGAPQWSGIVADINEARGRRLGFINHKLYNLGGSGNLFSLFHDITTGDNSFLGVPGYAATPGFDLSTGWGTPKFGQLGILLGDSNEDSDPSEDP
jgi:subtilase family serine protease